MSAGLPLVDLLGLMTERRRQVDLNYSELGTVALVIDWANTVSGPAVLPQRLCGVPTMG